MKYLVIRRHHPESSEILATSSGDELNYERKDTTYPGWIWCTDNRGTQAWVPEAFVSFKGNVCCMVRDYISRELELEEGDKVELLAIESGWAWVLESNDEMGWIPLDNLEQLEAE